MVIFRKSCEEQGGEGRGLNIFYDSISKSRIFFPALEPKFCNLQGVLSEAPISSLDEVSSHGTAGSS